MRGGPSTAPRLIIRTAGPLTTLQDRGRFGYLRFGVPASGAMDPVALAVANALVGNQPDTAALELTLTGPVFTVADGPVLLALAGAAMPLTVDGTRLAAGRSHRVPPGAAVTIGPAAVGARAYLAVAGGFAAEPHLGSRSTHPRSRLGGWHGRAVRDGDALPLADGAAAERTALFMPPGLIAPGANTVRVVPGPQTEFFTDAGLATFLNSPYQVSPQADRMGYRLTGPAIEHARDFNTISDAIAPGSVQVPGTREPIVLMADRQTTGGYPKIATVIGADLPALGQRRPGDTLRFAAVSVAEAQAARRVLTAWLEALPARLCPATRLLDTESLYQVNLIGGVVDAANGDDG